MKFSSVSYQKSLLVGCALCLLTGLSALSADDAKLAEDPFSIELGQVHEHAGEKPWEGRSPDELKKWAKQNLHHKLTARRVIDANEHPEWAWFRESGLGLFLHWGPTSENPNTGDAWAMQWNAAKERAGRYMEPATEMFAVAETWNPEHYDPNKWLKAAADAGFGYSVLTARHHDGYGLWPSECGTWDTGDHMNGRDLVKDYVEASRANGMRVGLYYSGPNWHYAYQHKSFGGPKSGEYYYNHKLEKVEGKPSLTPEMKQAEAEESKAQVRELMSNYGPIDIIWWDGNVAMSEEELRPMQPDIFVARGNIATPEGMHQGASENVKVTNEAGWWWELCIKSENRYTPNWHYGVECETNHWDANQFLTELVRCRSLGGNLLVNVPPRGNGEMMEWFYQVCDEMAGWMAHSKEATYGVDCDAPLPTLDKTQNYTTVKGNVWYSMADDQGIVFISDVARPQAVTLLRTGQPLESEYRDGALRVVVPESLRTSLPDMVKLQF